MLKGKTNGLTISSETLQIYSHNSKESLLTLAKLKLEHFRKNPAMHFPQVRTHLEVISNLYVKVIGKKIRVKVGVCTLLTGTCSVSRLYHVCFVPAPSAVVKICTDFIRRSRRLYSRLVFPRNPLVKSCCQRVNNSSIPKQRWSFMKLKCVRVLEP